MERRTLTTAGDFKTRETENGEMRIVGYFAVFGSNYEIWDGATESIAPSAFDGALNDDIRCLINHETRLVLGRNTAGTLSLAVDDHGLYGDVLINPKDQDAVNLYERVKRRDVNQCSFGFDILDEDFTDYGGGVVHWEIKKVKLYEVSVCTFPAYEATEVEARKRDISDIKKRKFEAWKNDFIKSRRKEH